MTYDEYKKIINDAVSDYCHRGGSIINVALNTANKEYVYEYDEEMPEDMKLRLTDKAYQAMSRSEDLPSGIRLVRVNFM